MPFDYDRLIAWEIPERVQTYDRLGERRSNRALPI
jgi:hypothetical protein